MTINDLEGLKTAIRELPDYAVIQVIIVKPEWGDVGMTDKMMQRWDVATVKKLVDDI